MNNWSKIFGLSPLEVFIVVLFDLILGDPDFRGHPVRVIGLVIERTEKILRKLGLGGRRRDGLVLFWLVVGINFLIIGTPLIILRVLSQRLSMLNIFFLIGLSFFLAFRTLLLTGLRIERYLSVGKIEEARDELKALVGRDREGLSSTQIRKAIVESYAENLNDGVLAPLFWLSLLGWPGLLFYKVINTLDSMVGYKRGIYFYLGWFSAKMDDLLNYIPARITAFLICLSAFFYLGFSSGLRALKRMIIDGSKHESPNSGYPEAAMAGALGVSLLGPAFYGGILKERPFLGTDVLNDCTNIVPMAVRLLSLSYFFYLLIFFWVLS